MNHFCNHQCLKSFDEIKFVKIRYIRYICISGNSFHENDQHKSKSKLSHLDKWAVRRHKMIVGELWKRTDLTQQNKLSDDRIGAVYFEDRPLSSHHGLYDRSFLMNHMICKISDEMTHSLKTVNWFFWNNVLESMFWNNIPKDQITWSSKCHLISKSWSSKLNTLDEF